MALIQELYCKEPPNRRRVGVYQKTNTLEQLRSSLYAVILTYKSGCKIAKESLQGGNKMRLISKRFSNSYLHRAVHGCSLGLRNIACANEPLAKYLVDILVRHWGQPQLPTFASHPVLKVVLCLLSPHYPNWRNNFRNW